LIDAYAGLTVPIYSGDMSVLQDFNVRAFFNYQEQLNMDGFVESIKDYDTKETWYEHIYQQPLLLKEPSLDDAIAFVRSIVK
jgi:hypothetical protein